MSSTTATSIARDVLGVGALTDASLTRWLHGLLGVDHVGADARAAGLGTRSIKTTSKAWAIDSAISMIDLTTLEGADAEREVRSLCATAMAPDPGDPATPQIAAVCLYAYMVAVAVDALKGSNIPVATQGRRAQFAAEVCAAEGLTPARGQGHLAGHRPVGLVCRVVGQARPGPGWGQPGSRAVLQYLRR